MSTTRDALREQALKTRTARAETVQFDGATYVVRAPTVRERSQILKRAGIAADDASKNDLAALQVWAVIFCTRDPASGTRLFEDGDYAVLVEDPAGGLVDALAERAVALVNAASDKTAAKNS